MRLWVAMRLYQCGCRKHTPRPRAMQARTPGLNAQNHLKRSVVTAVLGLLRYLFLWSQGAGIGCALGGP